MANRTSELGRQPMEHVNWAGSHRARELGRRPREEQVNLEGGS